MPLTPEQYTYLLNPLRSTRVATRQQGGKTLSYLEAWEVKAHLTRIFGFGNWDSELIDYGLIVVREYKRGDTEMVECVWHAKVTLAVRVPIDVDGQIYYEQLCRYTEAAVGSTSGPLTMLGEHHDNALKTAESDALKRCAINLGTQFGLSLYDNGSKVDVVKQTLVVPSGWEKPEVKTTGEQVAALKESLGATVVTTEQPEGKAPNVNIDNPAPGHLAQAEKALDEAGL